MDITFGQHFDQGAYINYNFQNNITSFNKMTLGPLGLLTILERDLGLSGNFPGMLERRVRYRKIITNYLDKNPSAIYNESFQIDPEGVSAELLNYRDQLFLAGWTPEVTGISPKIDFLAEIEKAYGKDKSMVACGVIDRWMSVFQKINQEKNVSFVSRRIELNEPYGEMHPFFEKLFQALSEKGVSIQIRQPELNLECGENLKNLKLHISEHNSVPGVNLEDESLQIFRFKSDAEASGFIAAQANSKELKHAVILNRDNRLLDETLNSFGLPVSGSQQLNANPSLIQLFKLAAVLLVKPLHVYNFMSYLQVETHPVPPALRFRLMKVLKETGGVNNSKWHETLEQFQFGNEEMRQRVKNFLKVREFQNDQIERLEAIRLYRALGDWAQKRLMLTDNPPGIDEQLAYLKELCSSFVDILREYAEDSISGQDFSLLLAGVYQSKTFTNYLRQIGSHCVLANPGQLMDNPETLVWFDFYNENMEPANYTFLNSLEREKLQKAGIEIWSVGDQVAAHMKMLMKGLLVPNQKVVLVLVEKANGKAVSDHPVYSYLKANIPELEKLVTEVTDLSKPELPGWNNPETDFRNTVRLPEKQEEYQITAGTKIPKRQTESASSLELLIQYPFDWVFQYGAKIQPGNSTQLDDVHTTMGTVAHKFIETLFEDAQNDLQKAKALMEDYPSRLKTVVENYGMVLLLDENRAEYEIFTAKLINAVETLVQILEENNLSVEKMEQEEKTAIPALDGQEVFGKIDLVLRTSNGQKAIFDLKWSRRPEKYIRILRENKHIQLAVYHELLRAAANSEVDFVAYYSLSDARLISTKNLLGKAVKFIENTMGSGEILQQVNQSVKFRRMQIEKGIIEEGGGLPLEKLDYFNNQDEQGLFPLDTDYRNRKNKKINAYSHFKTFKGEIS